MLLNGMINLDLDILNTVYVRLFSFSSVFFNVDYFNIPLLAILIYDVRDIV